MIERLIGLLRKFESNSLVQGQQVSRGAPPISYLLFVDDSIFFCKESNEEAKAVTEVLRDCEEVSGQQFNFNKSSITFRKGIQQQCKEEILQDLDIREVLA